MQFVAFALSRLPDPFAIALGGTIGIMFRLVWQTVIVGLLGGIAMVFAFGLVGGMSPDAPAFFAVDPLVVTLWASLAFALLEWRRRRKSEWAREPVKAARWR